MLLPFHYAENSIKTNSNIQRGLREPALRNPFELKNRATTFYCIPLAAICSSATCAQIIRATSCYGSGSGSSSSSSSPASSAALLDFRPRFPLPFMTSFAARVAHASSMSSKLITFAFPSTTDLVDRRTLALLFNLVKN